MKRFMVVGAALALSCGVAGCSSTESADDVVGSVLTTEPGSFLDAFDCEEITATDAEIAPLRAAEIGTVGFSCDVHGEPAHVFERSNAEVSEIDRLIGGGVSTPGCDALLAVSDTYFAVAKSTAALDALAPYLGEAVRPVVDATPTVSYLGENCEL